MIHFLRLHERAVVETMGEFSRVKGPGLVFLLPLVQKLKRVDLREQAVELRTATIRYTVEDPARALYTLADYRSAMETLAQTMVKRELDARPAGALMSERDGIEEAVRKSMAEAVVPWGIRIGKVEVNR
jgi:regulator of protease activity HflC (stomatin/prohibitin superfamily)